MADPTPDPRKRFTWPEGAIPADKIKKWGAVSFAVVVGGFLFFSWGSPASTPQPTVNRFDPASNLPPAPARVHDLAASLEEERKRMEAQTEQIKKDSEVIAQQKDEYQRKLDAMNSANQAGQTRVGDYQTGNVEQSNSGAASAPKKASYETISSIVQDLRHKEQPTAAQRPVDSETPQQPTTQLPPEYAALMQKIQQDQRQPEQHPEAEGDKQPPTSEHAKRKDLLPTNPAWPTVILPQDTVIETVLVNKLEGSNAGQVKCMLTTPVYQVGTHNLLFPAGTEFLGEAASVNSFGQNRLAVVFHRAIVHRTDSTMYSVSFDDTAALDQEGATGLHDKVNNHWLSTFTVAGIVGGIAGLSEIGNSTSGFGIDPMAQFRTGVTQQMSQESMQIMSKFLNRAPTVTIRPGTRVKLLLVSDLQVPLFKEAI